ncbi:MAG TPA: sensor domain-containing diguanylate cyclase [Dissulfurispiraceae bacterium]|nr:sensor domain-containing diguanylate cyclase [Dissulfurispiraceae bacterium]
MSERIFAGWLQRFLSGDEQPSVPFEGLSSTELSMARQIENAFRKSDTLNQYSGVFLKTLDSAERFSELAIRAFSALVKMGELGETNRDVHVFCRHTAEIFTRELGFENCLILLRDPDTGKLKPGAFSAKGDRYPASGKLKKKCSAMPFEDIASRVAGSGDYIHIPDVSCDDRCSKADCGSIGVASLLSAPIKSGNSIIGVINCGHPLPGAFDENMINLVLILSNFTGQMITLINLHNTISSWNEALSEEVQKKTSELRRKNAKLTKLAVTDSLTNLFNRRFFFTRLEEEFSRTLRYHNEQFALLLMDLDNLKVINDTFGHVIGDSVLLHVAKCLKRSIRKGDVMGRLGGDEFGYIMLNADEEVAYHFALRLQHSIARVTFNGQGNNPTISIGIAAVSGNLFKKFQDTYAAADKALYSAKKKKNCVSIFGKQTKPITSDR